MKNRISENRSSENRIMQGPGVQTFFGPASPDGPACGSKFSAASGAELADGRLLLVLKILLSEHPISGHEKSWGHYQNS